MGLIIQKEEAQELLRKDRKHYLWNKHMSKWTVQDVYNLRNGININVGNILREKPEPKKPYQEKQTVIYRDEDYEKPKGTVKGRRILATNDIGQEFKFDSVVQASMVLDIPEAAIYNLLNGRNANGKGFTFKKLT